MTSEELQERERHLGVIAGEDADPVTRDVAAHGLALCKALREATARAERAESRDATVHMRIAHKNSALVVALRRVLASARPNPVEHPTMHAAWKAAERMGKDFGVDLEPDRS